MKPLHEQDLEALLTPDQTPEPPTDLAARLKAEIPDMIPIPANEPEPAAPGQRRWLIAAMLVTALGGGFLARQLLLDPPAFESTQDRAPATVEAMPPTVSDTTAAPIAEQEDPPPTTSPATRLRAKSDEAARDLPTEPTSANQARSARRDGTTPPGSSVGRVVGQVTGTDEGALPGATVIAREQAEAKKELRAMADAGGRFQVDGSTAGAGEASPEVDGFQENQRQPVGADPVQEIVIDDMLIEPPIEETITVTGESPLLDERKVSTGSSVSQAELERVPTRPRAKRPAAPATAPRAMQGSEATERMARRQEVDNTYRQLAPAASKPLGGPDPPATPPYDTVIYREYGTNPFVDTEDDRLSTFAVDVDTGSYGIVRRHLRDGNLPPAAAVRVEELVNAFDYRDPAPRDGSDFALHAQGGPAPFATYDGYHLLRFNLRGREVAAADRRPVDLIFVVDVSGSMAREDRLGLVKRALTMLIDQLRPDDRLALVTYGNRGQIRLAPTTDHASIRLAVAQLTANGSTNAEEGLVLAYGLATTYRRPGAMRRVLLLSDGVANVGATGPQAILGRIRDQAGQGVELTTVGVGMGNYNDVLMEQLANQGNGRYAYVDDLAAAHRLFVEQLSGTLQTIAADAKVQVDFDPEVVARYRLLGYENRDVADRDFRNDKVDAGEIGAGHSVTALYEIKLHPAYRERLRRRDVVATLTMRWGSLARGEVVEATRTVTGADFARSWEEASPALQLTAVIAEWAELLKGTVYSRPGETSTVDPFHDLLARAQRVQAHFPGDPEIAQLVGSIGQTIRLRSVRGHTVP